MFRLIAYDVATSWSCRDIHSIPLKSSIVAPDVVTSIRCRDISSSLLQPSTGCHDVATLLSCRDITLCFCRLHWLFLMSRPQFLSRHHSFNFCSFLRCLYCDPCRDLHQIPYNFPDVATSELDCADPQLHQRLSQLLSFLLY